MACPPPGPECGDGKLDTGEVCDGALLGDATCQGEGFVSGTLACNDTCDALDTSACVAAECGDGARNGAEACEGTDLGGATCASLGFGEGTLTCSTTCAVDTSACCGDGVGGGAEVCDGADLRGVTCDSLGYRSGTPACQATCGAVDTSGCCGDGQVGGTEQCDDGNDVDGDGCQNSCTETPPVDGVQICRILDPLPSGVCQVTPGTSGATLIVGDILQPGLIRDNGHVLVASDGTIACVGCNCAAQAVDATVVTCPQGVVSPGLINSHDHITYSNNLPVVDTGERYEQRHDWRKGLRGHTMIPAPGGANADTVRLAELRFVLGGTTAAVSAGSQAGLIRNLDSAALEAGLDAARRMNSETFPLDDGSGLQRSERCDYGSGPDTEVTVASIAAYQAHVSEGIDLVGRNEFFCTSNTFYDTVATTGEAGKSHDLVQPTSAFVHGVGLKPADYAAMAKDGTVLVWSPRSNVSLYGDTAVVTAAHRHGVTIALGTDWLPSGSMNLNRELVCADQLNASYFDGYFTDEELWKMVTINGAIGARVSDRLGQLAPGLLADVAIFDGQYHPGYRAVVAAEPKDVALVLRAGKVLSGDASVVAALSAGCDVLDVCGSSKRVCLQTEIGKDLAALDAATTTQYPKFFCDAAPANEPTCKPARSATWVVNGSSVYTGDTGATDYDGDGITDGSDNCPRVFNPIRPVDNGVQADFDHDGVGDACDVCPMDAASDTCSPFDADDWDGDLVPNTTDSCPFEQNPAPQADADVDGRGDACDLCPNDANPGLEACPATIFEVKTGVKRAGDAVKLVDVLVTARNATGYFLQDTHAATPDFSGVFVYDTANTVAVGERITIGSTTINPYQGQIQLASPILVTKLSSGNAPPTPVVVASADATRAAELEGVVVSVENVTVTGVTPAPANEYQVDVTVGTAPLQVNDTFHLTSPFPVLEERYTSITGVLQWRTGGYRLEPRSAADVVVDAPALVAMTPALSYLRMNQTGTATFPGALRVELTRPALSDTFVAITADPATALTVTGGGVTVPAGSTTATADLVPVAQTEAVLLTATLDGAVKTATVRVLGETEPATLVSLTASAAVVGPSEMVTFTVGLDIPPHAEQVVNLALAPDTFGTIPASVTVPADQLQATFVLTAAADVSGTGTVTAELGAVTLTQGVTGGFPTCSSSKVVLSQVFGGGGNSGSIYKNDFIELHNRSASPVDISGWSVQYGSASGTSWSLSNKTDIPANTVLAPGAFYLIQQAAGSGGTTALPTPDLTGTIAMGGTAGKVALVKSTTLLTGSGCPLGAEVADFIGYGTTNCSEGTSTAPLSSTLSAQRNSGACTDTGNNQADFTVAAPAPRNGQTTAGHCGCN